MPPSCESKLLSHLKPSDKIVPTLTQMQVQVTQVSGPDLSDALLPSPRTYHATTLVDRFMVVVGGESNSSDLNDLWALDLETYTWFKPSIMGQESFLAKRFHTANTINGT